MLNPISLDWHFHICEDDGQVVYGWHSWEGDVPDGEMETWIKMPLLLSCEHGRVKSMKQSSSSGIFFFLFLFGIICSPALIAKSQDQRAPAPDFTALTKLVQLFLYMSMLEKSLSCILRGRISTLS